jgi:CheY-like chemotaxis protein
MGQQLALVVEGDAICLRALSTALDTLNVRYKRNASGQYVIEQVRAMTPPPDLILLDLDLPQGDALEIAEALRADPAARLIPIILIADGNAFNSLPRAQQKWFAGTLSKPISRPALAALIAQIAPQPRTLVVSK